MRLALDPSDAMGRRDRGARSLDRQRRRPDSGEFVEADEPPEDLEELLGGGARVAAGARARLARRLARELALAATSCSSTRASTRISTSRRFSPLPGTCRWRAWTRTATGPGCAGRSSNHRPGPEGFGGFFVVHGHTPNDGRRDASHEDQIAGFRLNLDAGSGLTGVAKMAIIRGRQARGGRRARTDQPGADGGVTRPMRWRSCLRQPRLAQALDNALEIGRILVGKHAAALLHRIGWVQVQRQSFAMRRGPRR